ncbi:hypothetical protein HK102_000843 [Quaeritorhiza haematococci]|nr:hypothetical protein HK102_000843 [Quaeritorhiza haematococci]
MARMKCFMCCRNSVQILSLAAVLLLWVVIDPILDYLTSPSTYVSITFPRGSAYDVPSVVHVGEILNVTMHWKARSRRLDYAKGERSEGIVASMNISLVCGSTSSPPHTTTQTLHIPSTLFFAHFPIQSSHIPLSAPESLCYLQLNYNYYLNVSKLTPQSTSTTSVEPRSKAQVLSSLFKVSRSPREPPLPRDWNALEKERIKKEGKGLKGWEKKLRYKVFGGAEESEEGTEDPKDNNNTNPSLHLEFPKLDGKSSWWWWPLSSSSTSLSSPSPSASPSQSSDPSSSSPTPPPPSSGGFFTISWNERRPWKILLFVVVGVGWYFVRKSRKARVAFAAWGKKMDDWINQDIQTSTAAPRSRLMPSAGPSSSMRRAVEKGVYGNKALLP